MNKQSFCVVLAILVIGIAFFVLNVLTPEYLDDFVYKFMFSKDGVDMNHPINNVGQILLSQYNHYFAWNGRFVVHSIVQLFTGLLGKDLFNLFNTIVFLLFSCTLAYMQGGLKASNICFGCACVFLLFPSFRDTVIWQDGSVNYLWSAFFVLLFLLIIQKWGESFHTVGMIFLISLYGLLVGATQEGITFPLVLSLWVYVVVYRKTLRYRSILLPLLFFTVGSFFCAFSPATLSRGEISGNIEFGVIISKLINGFLLLLKLRAFYVLLVLFVFFLLKKGRKWLLSFYREEMIIFNAWILSFGIIFLSGFSSSRTAIGEELFSILLIIKLLQHLTLGACQRIQFATCCVCALLYIGLLFFTYKNFENAKQILAQIKYSHSSLVLTDDINLPPFLNSYIVPPFVVPEGEEYYEAFTYSSRWNKLIAKYYQRVRLAFIPRKVYEDICTKSDRIFDIRKQKKYPFYIIPVDTWDIEHSRATYMLSHVNLSEIPFYIRPFVSHMTKYTASEIDIDIKGIITVDDKNYLCLGKNHHIDNRINGILLK